MIELYTAATGNGLRALAAVEESGLSYSLHVLNLAKAEHKTPAYLSLNSSGRVPTLVDYDSGKYTGLVVTQSAAIIHLVAERCAGLLPSEPDERAAANEWFAFFYTDVVAPTDIALYLRQDEHVNSQDAEHWLEDRAKYFLAFADRYLRDHEFFAGSVFSIADVAAYPTIAPLSDYVKENFPYLDRWHATVRDRRAVSSARKELFGCR